MTAGSFNAAMIQMRSSLKPSENIDAAVRLIGEAKAACADNESENESACGSKDFGSKHDGHGV